MSQQLYFGMNGKPLNSNNYSKPDLNKRVIQRQPNIPNINDKPNMNLIHNNNKVNNGLLNMNLINNIPCNIYCIPLLILVIIITVSIVSSLCVDVFKNNKITLNILIGVIVNIAVVVVYTWLCSSCRNNNVIVQIIVNDIMPWVIYVLLIGLIFLYISNRVIKK